MDLEWCFEMQSSIWEFAERALVFWEDIWAVVMKEWYGQRILGVRMEPGPTKAEGSCSLEAGVQFQRSYTSDLNMLCFMFGDSPFAFCKVLTVR